MVDVHLMEESAFSIFIYVRLWKVSIRGRCLPQCLLSDAFR